MGFSTLKRPWKGHQEAEKDISHHVLMKHRDFTSGKLPLTDSATLATDFPGPQFSYLKNGEGGVWLERLSERVLPGSIQ